MFNKLWTKDMLERAVKTFIQAYVATMLITVPDTETLDWTGFITWQRGLVISAVATVLSVLFSVGSKAKDGTLSPASVVPSPTPGAEPGDHA